MTVDRSQVLRLTAVVCLLATAAFAVPQQIPVPRIEIGFGPAEDRDQVSAALQILALLTVLSLAPAILMLTTAFTRIVIILSLLRTAIGTQSIPPNQVLIGLSLFLTLYVMAPTFERVQAEALQPYMAGQLTMQEAVEEAKDPMRDFMLRNTYTQDLQLFLNMRGEQPESPEDVSMVSLIPAFVISELKTAFIVGFYLFIPFVIIDLIVASVLMSMGMMMMPPVVVSLPAKLLVFILADGWTVLVTAILSGYM
jgi:flagellar biosynthetic protein FliP